MSTVALALRAGAARLSAEGIDAGDARYLLAYALGVGRDRLMLMGPDTVPEAAQTRYEQALSQRLNRVPVSKIIGTRAFWGRDFTVTENVLDPRPETESLIAEALSGPVPARLLDLGTGSGCIAITLLTEWTQAQGVATDVSPAALEVAAGNADALGVAARLNLCLSDWFGAVEGEFDLIVSNPPYISETEMAELTPEVLNHDPHLALTPGGDGLAPYRVIAQQGRAHLTPAGRALVEIGWKQGADVADLFRQHGWTEVRVLPDLDGRDRVVAATRG